MSESFTQTHASGWTITVRMLAIGLWQYIASKGLLFKTGTVDAIHRTEAMDKAQDAIL